MPVTVSETSRTLIGLRAKILGGTVSRSPKSLAVALSFLSLLKWSGDAIKTWAARVGPNGKIDELVCAVRLGRVCLANGCTRFTYIFNVLNYELNFVLHYLFLKLVVSCYAMIFHVVFLFENFRLLSQHFAILSTFKKTS